MSFSQHSEHHFIHRSGWLRAAVLGANDGIISVTSLIIGMAASGATAHTLLITCIAGLISGATSMAAGEYISVKSQEDIEKADLKFEAQELKKHPQRELDELTQIYVARGLEPDLARQVATQLTNHDALGAHARDEIGIHENTAANPIQAALASAGSFSFGALFPMLAILLSPEVWIEKTVLIFGIISLAFLGALSSHFAGTSKLKGSLRITLWGILAMAFSSWIGSLFHVTPL
ncbi:MULTISPECIES: VIT1/CCC1 transporter family protein [Acinetobacter]|jgi:VIT1/CCC1 family predicted Fe2+/Mn2+ transporter|uniref:VIT family protein n=1 Tax=Acinetobacter pittii TaxID=48296 RepID=A0A242U614_ACIPI|nr:MULTISPECIES: VIT family protein [Acinetobacter]MBJ8470257.1 VIT family protein [Acinetobacter pittii]MBJ8500410.1 VIT family protein [Acinetobacter pittii]MBJ9891152.1 VIT family protein [Acinetobacter pittii]MCU4477694.1 VIT family protein [Acinetobacter sp. WU_MDCI_Abxd143]MDN4019496.1 VIT family protein [Acinetobacter pittii]